MCNIRNKNHSKKEIKPYLFTKLRNEVFPYAEKVFLSCGREPLLTNKLEDYLEKTHSAGVPQIELITNGMLMTKKISKILIKNKVFKVTISLDSPDGAVLPGLRPGSDLSMILNNVRQLHILKKQTRSVFPHIRFNLVLQKKNYQDLNRYLELGYRLGVKEFKFQHLIVFSSEMEKETLFHLQKDSNEYLQKAVQYAFDKGLKLEIPLLFADEAQNDEENETKSIELKPVMCHAPWNSVIFEPDGRIISCCSLDMITMGNIQDDSFMDIWNSEQYRNLRKAIFYGENTECKTCCLAIEAGDPNNPHSIFRQQLNVSR